MCIGCGRPWPCPPRRRQLLDTYADSPTALALVLSSALMDACRDLPNVRAGELYQQVVGWLPSFRNSGRRGDPGLPTVALRHPRRRGRAVDGRRRAPVGADQPADLELVRPGGRALRRAVARNAQFPRLSVIIRFGRVPRQNRQALCDLTLGTYMC
jgi:hypothetical protein